MGFRGDIDWRLKAAKAFAVTFIVSEAMQTLHAHSARVFIQSFSAVVAISLSYLAANSFYRKREEEYQHMLSELTHKNTYLEHAAKIIRHDMHSGINTYIPIGVSSLQRRLPPEVITQYKLSGPLKLITEGLAHTQKVYAGVKDFTNLVRQGSCLEKVECDLTKILVSYLSTTAYKDQVAIDILPKALVNESLFCTAVDNLIRNGLKYNDSDMKMVAVFTVDDEHIGIKDNGRGMSVEEFNAFSKSYVRKEGQKESGSGLGLNICIAILQEHGFKVTCVPQSEGTLIKIKVR
jgi:light-regulated signal transduction histidine kinase (bacteriophytochrome)